MFFCFRSTNPFFAGVPSTRPIYLGCAARTMSEDSNYVWYGMEATKTEQEKVVRKLKEALDFFENVQISNDKSLDVIKKTLDDLLSSLKYIPVDQRPCFNDLPVEIKMKIFDYICDSGAFVAATVCQDWNSILKTSLVGYAQYWVGAYTAVWRRPRDMYVSIGKCCLSQYVPSCNEDECFMPEEKLKASVALGMDIPLKICYPVTDLDSKLVVDGLMSVSRFKIIAGCPCREDDIDGPLLSRSQTKDLFDAMEKKTEIDDVELQGLDMTHLDQDKLIDCLFKIKNLTLTNYPILDFERFVEKLALASINSIGFKLSSLHLSGIDLVHFVAESPRFIVDLANALCNVKSVDIGECFPLESTTVKLMILKVMRGGIRLKSLSILDDFDWRSIISKEDLRMLIFHMERLLLFGRFSQEQVDAVKWLPGVEAERWKINKGFF